MEQDKTQHLQSNIHGTSLRKCPQCQAIYNAIAFCPNDGAKLEEHQADGLHQALFAEKYEILEEIGKGGMGTVYRVKQVMLDKILALKVIPSHFLNEQLTIRFQREAKTMASLDHPNLARISDFGIWLNQPFMVIEYIDGAPLSKLISERVLPPAQAVALFCQVLSGLQHAHIKGVLHRDIKPSNIMVCSEDGKNKAILLDFGIAKKIETEDGVAKTQALTRTGEMIGSPLYMSPEQARGDKLTERSDLYSLGCALFESLTGTPPFVGKTAVETFSLHLEQNPPTLKEAALGREFAPGLEKLIRKLLSKNPDDRFASAEELKQALALCSYQDLDEVEVQTRKKKEMPIVSTVSVAAASILLILSIGLLIYQGEQKTKKYVNNVQLSETVVNKLPESLSADQFSMRTGREVGQYIQTGTDSSMAFYKSVLTDKIVQTIVNDINLKKLSISHSSFPKSMLAHLPAKLEYLELNGAGLLNDDFHSLAANTNLKTLVLRFNIVNARGLHHLTALKNLQFLDLNGTHVDAGALKELRVLKSLKTLILSANETIDDAALRSVSALNQLEYVDISDTRATKNGLSELSKMANLKKLGAKGLMLDDNGIIAFRNFSRLETLNIAANIFSARGFKLLPEMKNLKELDISENHIDDDVVPSILRYKNLSKLHISKTQISPNGIMQLSKLPLKELWAKRTGLTMEQARDFMKACPSCQAVYYMLNNSNFPAMLKKHQ